MNENRLTSHEDVRRHNLGRILRHLHVHGPVSRSELATVMKLNRSTVGDLVATLGSLGLVVEEAGHRGTVGRPSLVVAPVAHAAAVIAYRIDADAMTAALIGLGGIELARVRVDGAPSDPAVAIEVMTRMAADLMEDIDGAAIIVGVGVGVPGTLDASGHTVIAAPNLGWTDVRLVEPLAIALSDVLGARLDVRIANNANLGAVAEHLRGAAVGRRHVVYLLGGVGIGAGLIVDDRLDTGASGRAGEIGHMTVDPNGMPCSCGSRGCWETVLGRDAVLSAAGREPGAGTVAELIEAADDDARAAVAAAVASLEQGIAVLAALLDPEVVLLSGHLADLLPLMARDTASAGSRPHCQAAALGADAVLAGAAEFAFAELLADPTGAGRGHTELDL